MITYFYYRITLSSVVYTEYNDNVGQVSRIIPTVEKTMIASMSPAAYYT